MAWYKRLKEGILTSTSEKKEAPEGVWVKCPKCKKTIPTAEHKEAMYICTGCGYHFRLPAEAYFELLFDKGKYNELFEELEPVDFLNFKDLKSYTDRLTHAQQKTGMKEAIRCADGKLDKHKLVITAMDFRFIGGSMGAVVGEKIARSIDYCVEHERPLLIISKSGGARMMESAFSLMQMAKTASRLTRLSKARLPYISLMTDPTTGGVTASFAMLGDMNIAEPGALIGFAGPRVIKETIKKELPDGFQSSEFLMDHGFLDFIVERKHLKAQIAKLLYLFAH